MDITEGQQLWTPSPERTDSSNLKRFISWLNKRGNKDITDYRSLWQWSVENTEDFWAGLWDYFDIQSGQPYSRVVTSLAVKPGERWFVGSQVNWAEHVLRPGKASDPALYGLSELRPLSVVTRSELRAKTRQLATAMRARGVKPGDRVCALMPNIPETVIAMLAVTSIGAVWSSSAPEFGLTTILDRFNQLRPKWLFVTDGYRHNGKDYDRRERIASLVDGLRGSVEKVIFLPYLDPAAQCPVPGELWQELLDTPDPGEQDFSFTRVPSDHPLWVLFSSGTTGLPKAIVHSHVGILITSLAFNHFHLDAKDRDITFFYSSTSWIAFHSMVSGLGNGGGTVLYDGSPVYPNEEVLWKMAEDTGVSIFGASPSYVRLVQQANLVPGERFDLSKLKTVVLGGAPSTPETFAWFYQSVKSDLWVTNQSGGTEMAGSMVGSAPTEPVFAGEIQAPSLGMAVKAWNDDREEVLDDIGELVCTRPFPSMPLYFLNDEQHERYYETYFSHFPGVWRHGDLIKFNQRGGCYIYGRSDSTLNRNGVRIGTAEIYREVELLDEVDDSLVVCIETAGGEFFMPMFVQLAEGIALDDALCNRICRRLKEQRSPRHVPDEIRQIQAVPYTLTGKKMEVPVRKLLTGVPLEKAASKESMRKPESIDFFVKYAESFS